MKRLISWFLIVFNIHIIEKNYKKYKIKTALNYYKYHYQNSSDGICFHIHQGSYNTISYMWLYYPEIYIQKPFNKKTNEYWFNLDKEGITKRIKILENGIKLIK